MFWCLPYINDWFHVQLFSLATIFLTVSSQWNRASKKDPWRWLFLLLILNDYSYLQNINIASSMITFVRECVYNLFIIMIKVWFVVNDLNLLKNLVWFFSALLVIRAAQGIFKTHDRAFAFFLIREFNIRELREKHKNICLSFVFRETGMLKSSCFSKFIIRDSYPHNIRVWAIVLWKVQECHTSNPKRSGD